MRSNRDEPRGRARLACVRVAEESGGPPQPPSVVVRLSPHADAHTARPVATGRSRAPARSPSSIACTRWLEASTVRDDVRAYRRARGWVAFAPHASSGVRTAAASESYCAGKLSRAHVPRVDVGVATHHRRAHGAACVPAARVAARTVGKDAAPALRAGAGAGCALRDNPPKPRSDRATVRPPGPPASGTAAHSPRTGRAGARPAAPRRCAHHPKQRSDCATVRPLGPPASGAPAHCPGRCCAPACRAISLRGAVAHLRDQMGPGARRRGVPGDLAGARRRLGSRPLAALPLPAAAAVARRHAACRRRARDARTPARHCRLATLRSWPSQLVRTTIPSTCARARRATPRHGGVAHLRDQMGPGARRRGVPRDLAGARRRLGSRPLAALPLAAAAAVARRHAACRRRARDARTPARHCRLATLRSRPSQLVRTAIPSTRNVYSGSVYSTFPNGDRCLI